MGGAKIEDQREFVRWWDERVTVAQGPGRGKKTRGDPRAFSMDDAETEPALPISKFPNGEKR
ncbi:hypothetical protein CN072_29415 [Sinorhizobium meliloti]|uniref:hypothetical protein n=1 Tax=Rhizobium meliloti TaxID=382 RepID=UPI000FD3ABC5|nr:hypothetical protein [Sinorhizobium meliloti]RVP79961.1 hypothetical protein CN072_29415 [Sinorhizobium meliloti]